jgi:polar amino acid transport system substrate-binding protein
MKYLLLIAFLAFVPAGTHAETLEIFCEDSPPYQMHSESGSLSGMTIDLVREIQKRVKNTDPIQMVPWNRAYTFALHKENVVLFSTVMTDERKDLFQWIGPIADVSMAFYAKKGNPLTLSSHEEAKKVRAIAVYGNDISQQYLQKLGYRNLMASYDNMSAIKSLMLGRVDLVSIGRNAHKKMAQAAGYEWMDLKEVFVYMQSPLYITFSKKTSAATVSSWNKALLEMKKDGTFASIFYRYFPDSPLP